VNSPADPQSVPDDGEERINGASVAVDTVAPEVREDDTPSGGATPAAEPATPSPKTRPSAPGPSIADAVPPVGDDHLRRRDAWRRVVAVAVVLVAAFAVVVLWARPAHEPLAPAESFAALPAASGELNATDAAFLQVMIALDNSALPLLDLMKEMPALQSIATTGGDGHRAELVALRAALAAGGAVEGSGNATGRELPGLVLADDIDAVRAAPADQRAARAVTLLSQHLAATVALAASEGQAGADPSAKAAAQTVLDGHNRLLASLPTV
jgi:hypothetical protein